MEMTRIDLGLARTARVGRLTLLPALRTIRRDDGAEEIVEPRIMQVLLALVDAHGAIVRRDELTERCWEGRVVGEDAINRCLSRLRRVAQGIGAGSFRIETVTRIGYRLIELGEHAVPPASDPAFERPLLHHRRHALVGAAAAAGVTLAGGGAWWTLHRPGLSPAAHAAMERGMDGLRLMTLDPLTTAAAAFHEAVELAPDAAEPWGKLALTYRFLFMLARGQEAELDAQRARDAATTALRLDRDNGDAQATLATLQPLYRNWLAYDVACRPVSARHPDQLGIGLLYGCLLSNVGRMHDLNALSRRLIAEDAGWPILHEAIILSSWNIGRLDDADAAMDRAARLWPRHVGLWFTRQRVLAYSGRAAAALTMVEDIDHRPTGLPDWDFELAAAECRALLTRTTADIDRAATLYWPRARSSVGAAGNAAQFFAATGRLDDAFAILNAIYFNRGFDVGERYFTEEQGTYAKRRDRATWLFWMPFMAELRADPRAAAIMRGTGLSDYWRRSGRGPDFPVAGFVPR